MLATDIFVDLFFVGDIVLNFNTGFIKEQVKPDILTPQHEKNCSSPLWTSLSGVLLRCLCDNAPYEDKIA